MRWDDLQQSMNVEDRRGDSGFTGGRAAGMGIGGMVVVGLISYITGINPAVLLGGYEMVAGRGGGSAINQPAGKMGAPDDEVGRFVSKVLGSTEGAWQEIFAQKGQTYQPTRLVMYNRGTRSGCGAAQSAMGPFYCPTDRKVYLDTAFFQEMQSKFNACERGSQGCQFSYAYVIAHEVGHHVQHLMGILDKVHQVQGRMGEAQSNQMQVRVELQADCFAGVWANRQQQKSNFIDMKDVQAAMQTAAAIGDDMLQKRSQGYVVPDSFTHGSSAQRQKWFMEGLRSGDVNACNTFQAQTL